MSLIVYYLTLPTQATQRNSFTHLITVDHFSWPVIGWAVVCEKTLLCTLHQK